MSDQDIDKPSSSKRRKIMESVPDNESTRLNGDASTTMTEEEEDVPPPAFVHQYHVVKNIIEHLRIRDVFNATQVNKQWCEIGEKVRKRRRNCPCVMLYHPYEPSHILAFEFFNRYRVSEEAKELVEANPKQKWYPHIVESVRASLQKDFLNAYDEPQMLIGFGIDDFSKMVLDSAVKDGIMKKKDMEIMKLVSGGIQERIPCISSFSCGLVAALPGTEYAKSLELENYKFFPCMAYLTIPKIPGLRVRTFVVTKGENNALKGMNYDPDLCRKTLNINPEEEASLKGIVLLHKSVSRRSHLNPVIHAYLRENPKVALAGGVHGSVHVNGEPDDSILAGGILIFGDEFVRVASVALKEQYISKENRQKLENLKTALIPNGKSFAFMFACNGRGRGMHGRPNVEADLFNSLFPHTPLIGAFTYGEFCHEVGTIDNADFNPPEEIEFGYTTIFLLVSYKHPSDDAKLPVSGNSKV